MKRILFITLAASLLALPAAALDVGRVSQTQDLLEGGGRSGWGKPHKSVRPERVKAGERVLVLFRQDGLAAVVVPRTHDYGQRENWICGYLPDSAVAADRPAVGFASLQDDEGKANLRGGPGREHPVLGQIPVLPGPHERNCVFVLSQGEWSQVMTASGQLGYIHESRLRPWVLDVGDDADKRKLAQTILQARADSDRQAKAARSEVYIGCDLYYCKPGTARLSHCYSLGGHGRHGNWAAVFGEARDSTGHWIYFGGVPTLLLERVNGQWVKRSEACDGRVDPRMPIPESVRRAFRLSKS